MTWFNFFGICGLLKPLSFRFLCTRSKLPYIGPLSGTLVAISTINASKQKSNIEEEEITNLDGLIRKSIRDGRLWTFLTVRQIYPLSNQRKNLSAKKKSSIFPQDCPKIAKICQNLPKNCPKKCLKQSVKNFFWQSVKNFFWNRPSKNPFVQKISLSVRQKIRPS